MYGRWGGGLILCMYVKGIPLDHGINVKWQSPLGNWVLITLSVRIIKPTRTP